MSDSFSIRMSGDDGIAPPMEAFQPRPDEKGPKTVAIVLVMGAILMVLVGWGDIGNSMADEYPDAETMVEGYQNDNLSVDDYQEFHDLVKDDGAYSIRGYSLLLGGTAVVIGAIMLFKLKFSGVLICLGGSITGLVGGVIGSMRMANVSSQVLPEQVTQINEYMSYLCGACMMMCVALAALPVLNAAARAALDQRVTLVVEEE
tara:strand:- start:993 stop:1601 length:609 start_codon:yes stop_codon:yes gene_type:complete